MNAFTSKSPSSSSASASAEATPSARNLSFLRPVLSCGGALVVGAILIRLVPSPTQPTSAVSAPTVITTTPISIPASQVVQAKIASFSGIKGRTLPGQWQLTTDATGKATVAGEVARWVVQPGSHINAGESVVEISSGSASRPATPAEQAQSQAEQAQIKAAHAQTTLAQNLSIAQTQLAAAQDRVAAAQKRVADARVLVRRLLVGEKIPAQEASFTNHSRQSQPDATPSVPREQRLAQKAVDKANDAVSKAKDELDGANKAFMKAQKQAETTATALSKAEDDYKAEKIKSDVLQNARADADDATTALKEAQTRADVAQRNYTSLQGKVKTAQETADKARMTAQNSATPTKEPIPDEDTSGKYMTADQAATLVASALRESKAAARQADRIHARVDDYQRQVNQSSKQAQSAESNLQTAQQHVLDSVPRPTFTATLAPIAGTVTWISHLAREVGVGQTVFGISQGKDGFLRFADTLGAYKKLHIGQTLNAAAKQPSVSLTQTGLQTQTPTLSSTAAEISPSQAEFSVRITRISPPSQEGQPAQIDAIPTNGSPDSLSSGTASVVEAELPQDALPPVTISPNQLQDQSIVLPATAVLPRDGTSYVAVLTKAAEILPQSGALQPDTSPEMTLVWRPIVLKSQSSSDVQIASGLHEGEQVVNQPSLLLAQFKPEEKKTLLVALDSSG